MQAKFWFHLSIMLGRISLPADEAPKPHLPKKLFSGEVAEVAKYERIMLDEKCGTDYNKIER